MGGIRKALPEMMNKLVYGDLAKCVNEQVNLHGYLLLTQDEMALDIGHFYLCQISNQVYLVYCSPVDKPAMETQNVW